MSYEPDSSSPRLPPAAMFFLLTAAAAVTAAVATGISSALSLPVWAMFIGWVAFFTRGLTARSGAVNAACVALGLLAQMGLLTQLFSLMVPALGAQGAGLALSLATICAVIGRTVVGWLLPPGADRRMVAVANFGVQIAGSVALLFAGVESAPLLLLGCVLFGLGIGNLLSLPPLIAQAEWPAAEVGRVVAGVVAVNQTFYAFAPALFGGMREFAGDWAVPVMAGALQIASAAVLVAGRRR